MANSSALQILEDGARQTVLKWDGVLDTSDLGSTTILDPSAQFIDPINPTTKYRIDRLDWSISDPLVVRLLWAAATPVKIIELAGRGNMQLGMVYGGLQNNATSPTGIISGLTTGYVSGTVAFTVILRCIKQ